MTYSLKKARNLGLKFCDEMGQAMEEGCGIYRTQEKYATSPLIKIAELKERL